MNKIRNKDGCYPPHCKVKDTAYILGKRPPCVTGLWKVSLLGLIKKKRNVIEGPCALQANTFSLKLSQNNRFVTGIQIVGGKPQTDELIGVWTPQIVDGRIVSWNLIFASFFNNGELIVSILKKDKHNRVEKMISTYIGAGFSSENSAQRPVAQQAILTRM